jgi:hypothetical protein
MKSLWVFPLLIFSLFACKSKKAGTDEETMKVGDFMQLFPEKNLPFSISDSGLAKLKTDSSYISYKLLAQFVGDSVLTKQFGKNTKPKIYPLARVSQKKGETYLFLETVAPAKRSAYLLAFDKDENYKAILPLIINDGDPKTSQSAAMDARYTISVNKQRKKPNGELGYKRDAYVYNNVGTFTLILTESNESPVTAGEIINPVDTLPRKSKYSADYVKDKRNFISVRDGRKPSVMRFFVHFEKDNGTCKGELRGEANYVKPNVAIFRESGDPCVLEFTFSATSITMKELEGCGNYRDIRCFFEGSFPRKKETKSKSAPKKK